MVGRLSTTLRNWPARSGAVIGVREAPKSIAATVMPRPLGSPVLATGAPDLVWPNASRRASAAWAGAAMLKASNAARPLFIRMLSIDPEHRLAEGVVAEDFRVGGIGIQPPPKVKI